MYRILEQWHHIPWIDPVTKQEYPEVKYSMLRLLEFTNTRLRRDKKKADAEARHRK